MGAWQELTKTENKKHVEFHHGWQFYDVLDVVDENDVQGDGGDVLGSLEVVALDNQCTDDTKELVDVFMAVPLSQEEKVGCCKETLHHQVCKEETSHIVLALCRDPHALSDTDMWCNSNA